MKPHKKPVTVWLRYNKKNERFEHNHIEDGHVAAYNGGRPKGKTPEQIKAWADGIWTAEHRHLDETGKIT